MKQRLGRPFFLRSAIAPALIGIGLLSGCASATIDDAVPTAASQNVSEPVETALSSGGPKNTGTFPNLNIPRQAANEQITPEQKASETAALQAAQTKQAANSTASTTDPEELRKLAATHAEDALKAIEAQQ